jgi:SAM-dependent methyltransferase
MPFFSGLNEAARYAQSRPYFHPLAIGRAKEATGLKRDVLLALDVACGTGQSAAALTSIAEQVVGLDISRNMLANAVRNERLRYVQARAEALPFQSGLAPLMSTALAFHWFDRDCFLREAWRVLYPEGWLLIYNNGFTGAMREDPTFKTWSWEVYPARFPTPPRDNQPFTATDAAAAGFELIAQERYENDVSFSRDELVAYLTTQTNVGAAIDQGRESLESASQWLMEQVRPYFSHSKATFVFSTRAWYLKKQTGR